MLRIRSSGGAPRRVASSSGIRRLTRPLAVEQLEDRTLLATFVVTDAGDAGPGTLRQAILDANTLTSADTINFNIPGDDPVRTIRPLSALPEITGQTTIDGRSQAGVVIQLDGSLAGAGANGLTVSGSRSVVTGLVINRFAGNGIALGPSIINGRPGITPSGIQVQSNFIGTDWTGNVALGNGGTGILNNASATVIGVPSTPTTATAGRNIISGNGGPGIWISQVAGSTIEGTGVFGNYIGTDFGGSRALPNGREGILVDSGFNTNIGTPPVGLTPAAVAARRNVISGNASSGIRIVATSGSVTVRNNYVGTNAAGTGAVPNGWSAALPFHDGITVSGSAGGVKIGARPLSTLPTVQNVISGNAGAGVFVDSGLNVEVVGNYIGTDATGNTDVGNGGNGITLAGNSESSATITGNLVSGNDGDGVSVGALARLTRLGGNFIGTTTGGNAPLGNRGNGITLSSTTSTNQIGFPGFGNEMLNGKISPDGTTWNVISANGGHGILVTSATRTSSPLRTIVNNYIGTDASGTLPLGNAGSGIYIQGGNVTVGATGAPNLISANGGNGITIFGSTVPIGIPTANNLIQGNRIGVAVVGTGVPSNPLDPGADSGLGNRGNGIAVYYSAGNRIGTGIAETSNIIAYNDGNGVLVEGAVQTGGTTVIASSALISGNGIYGNKKLGIDLSPESEGVTPNDARDADTGPNNLQNYPTLIDAITNVTGTSVQIHFVLMSEPGRSYRVEFFSSPLADPSGYGEGRSYLGTVTATTDSNGAASGTFTAATLPAGSVYFTATASQLTGVNSGVTSEFSPAVHGTLPPPPPQPQDVTTVTGRSVFYNDSKFDEDFDGGHTLDLGAVAPDKVALLPGQTASPANVTSYDKGINGIELTFFSSGLVHPQLGADDFEFKVGTGGDPSGWTAGPAPDAVTLVPVPGPNTVYVLTWPAGSMRNTWVQVTVKANADTGLASPDVFYFGNLVGETGDRLTPLRVSAFDVAATRAHLGETAGLDSRYDHNRDGVVNALDIAAVRSGLGHSLGAVTASGGDAILTAPNDSGSSDLASITRDVLG